MISIPQIIQLPFYPFSHSWFTSVDVFSVPLFQPLLFGASSYVRRLLSQYECCPSHMSLVSFLIAEFTAENCNFFTCFPAFSFRLQHFGDFLLYRCILVLYTLIRCKISLLLICCKGDPVRRLLNKPRKASSYFLFLFALLFVVWTRPDAFIFYEHIIVLLWVFSEIT